VVLVGGLTASAALDLRARGVEVVGPVPRGLPTPGLPSVEAGDLAALLGAGAALALVGLAEGLSAARLFAARGWLPGRLDQELFASGAANVPPGCSVASGWPAACPRRRPCARPAGRTQMAGLVAAGLALVVIVSIASALSVLPAAVLSAIVVNAVWKLMDFAALRRYARVRRNDIVAAVVARSGCWHSARCMACCWR
jgi:MFS superfamily sulfate permease-like transporter